jgi:hypothetical protein
MKCGVMLNPESVIPNLFRDLFRAGLVQHLKEDYETLKS